MNIRTLDAAYLWHPYTQMFLQPEAHPIIRAEGSYLYDSGGKKIFDAVSSWWVTLHGHAHPHIAHAIAQQAATLEQVIFAGFTHEPAVLLAQRLIERAPKGLAKVFYSDNGSTAVEVALKMSVGYWNQQNENRTTFLALEHSYHGDTFGAMSASSPSIFTAPFTSLLFDVVHLPFPYPPVDGEEMSESEERFLDTLRKECSKRPAAFIFEPLLLGAGGMLIWRKEIVREALLIARQNNVLTIADEVLTGFGRTGTFFAMDAVGETPDMMTLSKGLTGGFLPMGATLCKQELFDAYLSDDRSKAFFHGHSYTGSPLGCAAANASLDIFDTEPVTERMDRIHQTHLEHIPSAASSLGYTYRVIGTIAALEPLDREGYLAGSAPEIHRRALQQGVLLRPLGDTVYLLPPYSTTASDLISAYDVIRTIVGDR